MDSPSSFADSSSSCSDGGGTETDVTVATSSLSTTNAWRGRGARTQIPVRRSAGSASMVEDQDQGDRVGDRLARGRRSASPSVHPSSAQSSSTRQQPHSPFHFLPLSSGASVTSQASSQPHLSDDATAGSFMSASLRDTTSVVWSSSDADDDGTEDSNHRSPLRRHSAASVSSIASYPPQAAHITTSRDPSASAPLPSSSKIRRSRNGVLVSEGKATEPGPCLLARAVSWSSGASASPPPFSPRERGTSCGSVSSMEPCPSVASPDRTHSLAGSADDSCLSTTDPWAMTVTTAPSSVGAQVSAEVGQAFSPCHDMERTNAGAEDDEETAPKWMRYHTSRFADSHRPPAQVAHQGLSHGLGKTGAVEGPSGSSSEAMPPPPQLSRPVIAHPRHHVRRDRVRGTAFAPSDVVELLALAGVKRKGRDDLEEGVQSCVYEETACIPGTVGPLFEDMDRIDENKDKVADGGTRRTFGAVSKAIASHGSRGLDPRPGAGRRHSERRARRLGNSASTTSSTTSMGTSVISTDSSAVDVATSHVKRRRLHSNHVGEVALLLSFSKVSSQSTTSSSSNHYSSSNNSNSSISSSINGGSGGVGRNYSGGDEK